MVPPGIGTGQARRHKESRRRTLHFEIGDMNALLLVALPQLEDESYIACQFILIEHPA